MVHFTHLSILFIPFLFVAVSLLHRVHAEGNQHFSFRRWVDDISANPETALSPEEALQAYLDSSAADTDDDALPATGSAGPEKRWDSQVTCNDRNRAKAVDVVNCIKDLHKWPFAHCPTGSLNIIPSKGEKYTMRAWCGENDVVIGPDISEDLGQDDTKLPSCASVAQTVGVIMDTCTTVINKEPWVSGWRVKDLTGLYVGVKVIGAQTFKIG
ncbi:hypothetical protein QBC45DRAFT_335616 [Copromyces sp. CBS 386.78]|nr:hypothetical protein QBC45DRAFT_335616 [Copromyces sp. CBS 386.78]